MKHLRLLILAFAVVALSGCALLGKFGIGQQSQDAARGALTAYELAQEGALIYGALPLCKPELPAVKLCRSEAIWLKIKLAEDAATNAIITAGPVLRGDRLDAGEIADVILKVKAVSVQLAQAKTELGE